MTDVERLHKGLQEAADCLKSLPEWLRKATDAFIAAEKERRD